MVHGTTEGVEVNFGWRHNAGLMVVYKGRWALHFLVKPGHWFWGHSVDTCFWLDYYGLGPLFLLVKV
jgi:hypothetical protein